MASAPLRSVALGLCLIATACAGSDGFGGDTDASADRDAATSPGDGGALDGASLPMDAAPEDAGADAPARDAARDAPAVVDAGDAGEGGAADTGVLDAGPYALGPQPWEEVPADEVRETCKLDPELLAEADAALDRPWAVVRYGKLCHVHRPPGTQPGEVYSTTKTFSALVAGIVAYQTRLLVDDGPGTGPFGDEDRVDHWLQSFSYNPDARVAHVLAMIAHNESLAYGQRVWEYDTAGFTQINTLADMLEVAIAQDPERLGDDLEAFTRRFVFEPLGLSHSSWNSDKPTKLTAFSWSSDVYDMAKVGWLMLRGGEWQGERLLDAEWVYRMTHPAFEDANTGYGYLTWVNSAAGYAAGPVTDGVGAQMPGPCAPVSIYREHPHGLSESPDCDYGIVRSCTQAHDVGVWQALGLLGQVIQGHPGLDMVVVARNLTSDEGVGSMANATGMLWDALRPAVVAEDPTYAGDASAFCDAYGNNDYAPDQVWP